MGRIGMWEVIVIIGIIVLLFGAKKLPEIANSVAKAIKEFKRAGSDETESPAENKGDGQKQS